MAVESQERPTRNILVIWEGTQDMNAVSCLRCGVKPGVMASEDTQRRRCAKASKCGGIRRARVEFISQCGLLYSRYCLSPEHILLCIKQNQCRMRSSMPCTR